MKFSYPITIIDDFFINPNEVVKWAHSLKYETDPLLRYPGVRTKNLGELDINFMSSLSKKILSIFYQDIPSRYYVEAYFDSIEKNKYEEGWVHRDPADISFIIYLNHQYFKNCGTSLYSLKNNHIGIPNQRPFTSLKSEDFKNKTISTKGKEARQYINSQYIKELDIPSKFNRLLVFPSPHAHSANLLDTGTEEDRLILVGYIKDIYSDTTPLKRINSIFPDN